MVCAVLRKRFSGTPPPARARLVRDLSSGYGAGMASMRATQFRTLPAFILSRSPYQSCHWPITTSLTWPSHRLSTPHFADAAARADVRRTLRNCAICEVANNTYARGIVVALANDTIGTGPRLKLLAGDDDINRQVENRFDLWAQEVCLAEKLRTMRMARAQDGKAK